MKRRAVLRAIGALSVAGISPANAQPARSYRLAWVSIEQAGTLSPSLDALRDGLRELDYVEGRDYTITAWWGGGSSATLDAMVGDIVRAQPDVIVSQGGLALAPLIRAGVTIPIVFGYSGDPVDGKVVQSFARPGGTMTGILLHVGDRRQTAGAAARDPAEIEACRLPRQPATSRRAEGVRRCKGKPQRSSE